MASEDVTPIPLCLPQAEGLALAALVKRIGPEDCARYAAPATTYGDRPEADVMWSGVLTLQGALTGAGFVAR